MITRVNNNNPIFSSRNLTIRYADDICRQANNAIPRFSATKLEVFKNNSDTKTRVINRLIDAIEENRDKKGLNFDEADTFLAQIIAILKPVKHNKKGNCGESSHIGTICAKINGIRNCHPVNLFKTNGEDLDHMVVFVYDEKKPYIIDPWFGFADYIDNAITKYKYDFYSIFKLEPDEKITFASISDDAYTQTLKEELSRAQKNKLSKIYPKLRINKYY